MRITLRQQRVAYGLDRQTGRALAVLTAFAGGLRVLSQEARACEVTSLLRVLADCSADAFAWIAGVERDAQAKRELAATSFCAWDMRAALGYRALPKGVL